MSEISQEKMENIQQLVRDLTISNTNQSIIQDNICYFNVNGQYYRCSMPDDFQQSQAEDYKDTFKLNNLGKYPTEKQLRIKLKDAGIDLDALEEERNKIRNEYQVQSIKGACILSNEEEKLEEHNKVMNDIEKRLMSCIMEIEDHLSVCMQKKCITEYYRMLACLCTEKQENKDWVPVWGCMEEYQKDKSGVTLHAIGAIQKLLLSTRE